VAPAPLAAGENVAGHEAFDALIAARPASARSPIGRSWALVDLRQDGRTTSG
jgi:hypothetical protein